MDQAATRLKSCPDCDAQMPDSAAFCPGCGRSMQIEPPTVKPESKESTQPEKRTDKRAGATRENGAALLAYFTFLPAILFLIFDPYRRNPFVRFHSVQCLLCWLVGGALWAVLRLLNLVLVFVPVVGPLLEVLLAVIVSLAALLIWVVLLVKAYRGERFALPVIGWFAEQYSDV